MEEETIIPAELHPVDDQAELEALEKERSVTAAKLAAIEIKKSEVEKKLDQITTKEAALVALNELKMTMAIEVARRLMRVDGDKYFDRKTRTLYRKNSIDFLVDPLITDCTGRKYAEAFNMFLKGTPSYRGLVFDPSAGKKRLLPPNEINIVKREDGEYINMFEGMPGAEMAIRFISRTDEARDYGETIEDHVTRHSEIQKFLFSNICAGNQEAMKFLMSYLHQLMKRPHEKHAYILVLQGAEGIGKTTFFEVLQKVFGPKYIHSAEPVDLDTQFNSNMANRLIIFADEATFSGDIRQMNKLKNLTGSKVMRVEQKGIESYMVDNYARLVIATNESWAAPMERNSRRYILFKSINSGKVDWKKVRAELNDKECLGLFAAKIWDWKDNSWDFHSNTPPVFFEADTDDLKMETMLKVDPVGAWLQDDSDQEESIDYILKTEEFITSARAWEIFKSWWVENRTSHAREVTRCKLGIELQRRGYKKVQRLVAGRLVRCFTKD